MRDVIRARWVGLRLAPDGAPRPNAPFARGPFAARVLAKVIDGAVWAGSRVPSGLAHTLATIGGHGEWALRPGKRRGLGVNLAHALGKRPDDPAVRRTVRREIVNEAHRSADLLWALGRPREFLASAELDGIEYAKAAAAGGSGVILAGVHLGGWEVATAVPRAELPVPTTVIVADDWLAWAIAHMRVTAGLRVLYRTTPAIRAARLLQAGEALLVLGDDGWGSEPRTYPVRFLDSSADLPAGVVTLSRLCQAPIVGFAVLPTGHRRWRVVVDQAIGPPGRGGGAEEEQKVLQMLADRWSELIRAHPDQWAAAYRIRWRR
jgi:lauroyl/myristoyl acyltransferase